MGRNPARNKAQKRTQPAARSRSGSLTKARIKPVKAASEPAISIGARAPSFSLPRDGGGTVSLADFAGRKLVLYFYPRADTSGCTREAIDFSRLKAEFSRAGADIVGVSADPVKALDAFKTKHHLAVTLASDATHRALNAYGVWQEKSMYGRKFFGIVRRTFLIGPDQKIAQVWPRVSVAGHAAAVLAAAKAL
jgi:thioredoxin-dependent peroxiredoxin